jgi:hypothetical protein
MSPVRPRCVPALSIWIYLFLLKTGMRGLLGLIVTINFLGHNNIEDNIAS